MTHEEGQTPTLVHLLAKRAEALGEQVAKSFYSPAAGEVDERTYLGLDRSARAIAARLQGEVRMGDRALLLFPPGLDFTAAFFGCLYAGVVAVPAPPPDPRRLQRTLPRLSSILRDAEPSIVLTVSGAVPALEAAGKAEPLLALLPHLSVDEAGTEGADLWRAPDGLSPSTLAYLQYTSGSTAAPKGVMSNHGHLLENCRYLQQGFRYDRESTLLSWVPNFHDDGLVHGVVESIYTGFRCVRMSPLAVVRRPLDWLRAISDLKATHSGGPNFVYELTHRKVRPEECEGLDLSSWRMAYNAAEPVRPETLRSFAEAFSPFGFRLESFFPAFGMAETTLLVATKGEGETDPVFLGLDAEAMETEGRIVPRGEGAKGAKVLVGCGKPVGRARFEIVDPETFETKDEGEVGELWISDPCVAAGYWRNPRATAETFRARLAGSGEGPFLRTGDLAFLQDGELYVAGRLKDMIILRGRNLYPQDVEREAEQAHPLLRPGCGAAFGVEEGGEERLVVVHEVQKTARREDLAEIAGAVRQAVAEALDAETEAIVLIPAGSLPKTSSGKIQRRACSKAYERGELPILFESRQGGPRKAREGAEDRAGAVSAAEIADWMSHRLAEILGIDAGDLDRRQPFARFGLGSAAMVGLTAELESWLGRPLPETLLYEHPDLETLSRALGRTPAEPTPEAGMPETDTLAAGAPEAGAPEAGAVRLRIAGPASGGDGNAVAIVGMACRFPGAAGPAAFWNLLTQGLDAVREVPGDRWDVEAYFDEDPRAAGKMTTRWGGFLDRVDAFDPFFFGISPREAERMDPQQRLLLELAWEGLEDAAIPPDSLAGSATGVFVGIGMSDYGRWLLEDGERSDAYMGTGSALSVAANRLSYFFDFRGPSKAVDTACSSSLVAVLDACRSLARGESDLAIAGGVNLLLAPEVTVAFSKAGFMAPDGRCKAFDARADGYVRSEGAGLVVLKPLAQARRDGDVVYAVVRGGAVNQDGRSNGLTAPNPGAQEEMLRLALEDAGVAPEAVDTVEAHGTGTALGDPIEAGAIGRVLGQGRPADKACRIGSVKTNVGHLETAAGIAGLIKTALSFAHGERVPSLHFESPNPRIPLEELGLQVQTRREPWPEDRRLAGVSSFGFGGTNAHVIVQGAPAVQAIPEMEAEAGGRGGGELLFPLSAQSEQALRQRAGDLAEWLDRHPETYATQLGSCLALGRNHLDHRLAVVAEDLGELARSLRQWSTADGGEDVAGISAGRRQNRPPQVAFVFPGQGSQWPGMGLELYHREPSFRRRFDEAAAALGAYVEWNPLEALEQGREEIDVVQPLTFLLQVSLAELWKSFGVVPDAVVGHSLGEVAAACVAGALSLDDGCRVISQRSRLMRRLAGQGGMIAVDLPPAELEAILAPYRGRAEVAVMNSPTACAVSGEQRALEEVHRILEERGTFCRFIKVDVAAHGPQMSAIVDELGVALDGLQARPGQIPIFSTVTGKTIRGEEMDAAYWQRNLRQPVRFLDAASLLLGLGFDTFLEMSGHPLLRAPLEQIAEGARSKGRRIQVLSSLRREEPQQREILSTLGRLHLAGLPVHWQALGFSAPLAKGLRLPAYPWQRERFWWTRRPQRSVSVADRGVGHPLLGESFESARGSERAWQARLSPATAPFLPDHRVQGVMVFPGAAFVEAAMAAAGEAELTGVEMERALHVSEVAFRGDEGPWLQTVIFPDGAGGERFEIHSREDGGTWRRHVRGRILPRQGNEDDGREDAPEALDLESVRQRASSESSAEEHYGALDRAGYGYGPRHRGLLRLWRGEGEALAEIRPPASVDGEKELFLLHPSLLDVAWQAVAAFLPDLATEPWIPVGFDRHRGWAGAGAVRWAYARQRPAPDGPEAQVIADVTLLDAEGRPVAETRGFAVQRIEARSAPLPVSRDWLYRVAWRQQPLNGQAVASHRPGTWLCFADEQGYTAAAAARLESLGRKVVLLHREDEPAILGSQAAAEGDRALRQWLRSVWSPSDPPVEGVIYGWALDCPSADPERSRGAACRAPHRLVKELALGSGPEPPAVWLLTRGALAVTGGEDLSLGQAPLTGMGRVLYRELPELAGGLVDLDLAASPEDSAGLLVTEILAGEAETEVAYRGGRRFLPRLERGAAQGADRPIRGDVTYLLTGGSGGLGRAVAARLVEKGARFIALLSRRPASPEAVAALEEMGAQVRTLAADVADGISLCRALDSIEAAGFPPVAGVVHAAGAVDDGRLLDLDEQRFEAVLAPKWDGAWNLHRYFDGRSLDFFVLFSSAASVLGNPGQGSYSAANAFLDALAHHRRGRGEAATAINWGLWREIGFAVSGKEGKGAVAALERVGLGTIPTAAGLEVFGDLLGGSSPQITVLPASWRRLGESASLLRRVPLLAELLAEAKPQEIATEAGAHPGGLGAGGSLDHRSVAAAGADGLGMVRQLLRQRIAAVLEMEPDRLPSDQPLTSLGLDSLVAVELRNSLEGAVGENVPLAWLLQGSTLEELAGRVLALLQDAQAAEDAGTAVEVVEASAVAGGPKAPEPGEPGKPAVDRGPLPLSAAEAQDLLSRLDDLPQEEVDRLLEQMAVASEVAS